jgi:nitrile hydratase
MADAESTRFQVGDPVRTRADYPRTHCRTPFYLRGKPGVVERCLGAFRNPEELAYGGNGLPKRNLYVVRYEQRQLWPDYAGAAGDSLTAEIQEPWLEPA